MPPQVGPRQTDLDRPVAEVAELLEAAAFNNRAPGYVDPMWERAPFVDLSRWNKLYPYQLLVVEVVLDALGQATHQPHGDWAYTFPLGPEAVSVTTPFAITTQATQGGIIEDHNAAPFKMISVRGTTGLLPARGTAPQQLGFNLLQAVGGGTIQAGGQVLGAFASAVASATGVPPANPNTHDPSEFDQQESAAATIAAKTTGYFQARKLLEFLEAYATVRKTKRGRNLRLAFCTWKDEAVYLVTPLSLATPRQAASPLEYPFSLDFKAYRRVRLERASFAAALPAPVRRDPNALARLINTVSAARRVVQGISRVAAAAVGDFDRLVTEPLREVTLFAKDALGAAVSLAELPDAIKQRAKAAWVQAQGDVKAVSQIASESADRVRAQLQAGRTAANELRDMVTPRARAQALKVLASHPAAKPFEQPQFNLAFFEAADLGQLQLDPATARQVNAERARVRSLTRLDFEQRRDRVRNAADRLAVALGAGSATFEATYGVVVTPIKEAPTDSDWEVLWALNSAAAAMDSLAATGDNEPSAREDAVEAMAQLARRSGVAFRVPASKFAVPFPYGSTLELLAQRYLGDAQRWLEIAALNGLKEPYVDEVGFDLPLLTNGVENQVVVSFAEADGRLYIGQLVYVWSTFTRRVRRRVTALRQVGAQLVVTVDGDATMGGYQTAHAATLSAFLPDTVNSQSLVYIPSAEEPADDSNITKSIPGIDEFDPLVQAGGVDLLLDSNNDLIVTPDGDTRLAWGLTNIVQNTRLMMGVYRGDLLTHPDYGLPIRVGMSTADITAREAVDAIRRMLQQDPTFSRVDQVRVVKDGGAVRVGIGVVVAGTEQPVPIAFEVA